MSVFQPLKKCKPIFFINLKNQEKNIHIQNEISFSMNPTLNPQLHPPDNRKILYRIFSIEIIFLSTKSN
jgi:hypothetical protein